MISAFIEFVMSLETVIEQNLSRRLVDDLILEIKEHPAYFEMVFSYLSSPKQRLAWRSGWILCHLQQQAPHFFVAKQKEMMDLLLSTPYHGVRRSLLFLICHSEQTDYPVAFINQCFEWMLSPKQPPAIQVYSMYCLSKVCALYPDFTTELLVCLENVETSDYSKGFTSARKKTLIDLLHKKQ